MYHENQDVKTILVLFLTLCFQLSAQTEIECRSFLSKISNSDEFDSLRSIYPDWRTKMISVKSFKKTKDTIIFNSSPFLAHKNDGTKHYILKLLKREKREFCKLKYILINSTNLNLDEINQIQDQIITEHQSGKSVPELLEKFSQLGHTSSDLDWFERETLSADFENAVWDLEASDTKKLSIPSKGWHYVIFKTDSNILADVAECIKINVCHVGCVDPQMEMPEVNAEFPGGQEAMHLFIRNEFKYPESARKNKIEGQVILSFIVERNGSLSNIKILKGVSVDINNEAKRLVAIMPPWIPATHEGSKVRSRCNLPITFNLEK